MKHTALIGTASSFCFGMVFTVTLCFPLLPQSAVNSKFASSIVEPFLPIGAFPPIVRARLSGIVLMTVVCGTAKMSGNGLNIFYRKLFICFSEVFMLFLYLKSSK